MKGRGNVEEVGEEKLMERFENKNHGAGARTKGRKRWIRAEE